MKANSMILAALALSAATGLAAVTPSALFTRGMVLQRDCEMPVWGKADAGEKVTVTFGGNTVSTKAGADGNWLVKLPAMAASKEGRTLTIAGTNSITLDDVVVGDVFLYAGGNDAVAAFRSPWAPKSPWKDAELAKCSAGRDDVRFFRAVAPSSLVQVETVNPKCGPWYHSNDPKRGGKETKIAAWLIATRWADKTGVPCGIVSTAFDYRYFEHYFPPAAWAYYPGCTEYPSSKAKLNEWLVLLRGLADFGLDYEKSEAVKNGGAFQSDRQIDTKVKYGESFNGAICPLLKFPFRGAVYIDTGRPGYFSKKEFAGLMDAMFCGWRERALKDFPCFIMPVKGDWTNNVNQLVVTIETTKEPKPLKRLFEPVDPPSAAEIGEKLQVSGAFGDHMVLQRDKPVPIWGKAKPGAAVKVSYQGKTATAKADAAGDWTATLPALAIQKTGLDLVVTCGAETKTIADVLCGDVWYSSGQSNAEMTFNWGCIHGSETRKEGDKYPWIRAIKYLTQKSLVPSKFETKTGGWAVCDSKHLGSVSAMGYYFARRISLENDNLPIGIIDNNWSGSAIEPFIPLDGMLTEPFTAKSADGCTSLAANSAKVCTAAAKRVQAGATLIEAFRGDTAFMPAPPGDYSSAWNIMNAPIEKFACTGVVWYQGESNTKDGKKYRDLMRALVKGWRKRFGFDMPFYQVQLASFTKGGGTPEGGDGYAVVREVQREVNDDLTNFGTATAIDVGNENDIHPKNKMDVGERLALWALRDVYGKKGVVVSGPWFEKMTLEGAKARIHFKYVGGGLMAADKNPDGAGEMPKPVDKLVGFSIQGADGKWHFADSVIDGDTVVVSSPEVAEAKNVRYAYRASTLGGAHPQGKANLYNKEGLPALPFKTDPW